MRPYLRGTVGMALEWADTGGSQFFITHSPQPHLDGRYTAFGRVVNGMDVVDQMKAGDVIQRVRVWDGKSWHELRKRGRRAPPDSTRRLEVFEDDTKGRSFGSMLAPREPAA